MYARSSGNTAPSVRISPLFLWNGSCIGEITVAMRGALHNLHPVHPPASAAVDESVTNPEFSRGGYNHRSLSDFRIENCRNQTKMAALLSRLFSSLSLQRPVPRRALFTYAPSCTLSLSLLTECVLRDTRSADTSALVLVGIQSSWTPRRADLEFVLLSRERKNSTAEKRQRPRDSEVPEE